MPSPTLQAHVEREGQLLRKAIESLAAHLGSSAELTLLEPLSCLPGHPDAVVELRLPDQPPFRFVCEIKQRLASSSDLQRVHIQLAPYDEAGIPLVVTQHLTRGMLDWSRDHHRSCIDAAGNGHITAPGLLLHIRGNSLSKEEKYGLLGNEASAALASPAGLKVLYVCLTAAPGSAPSSIGLNQRGLARQAGVSLGSVNRILELLEANDFLVRPSRRAWYLRRRRTLLEFWLANYPVGLRPKLSPIRFSGSLPPEWWNAPNLVQEGTLLGGEVAHWLRFHAIQPASATLYVPPLTRSEQLNRLVRTLRLKPDPRGNIEILDRFWENGQAPDEEVRSGVKTMRGMNNMLVVPDLLIGADLMTTPDARTRTAVEELLESLAHED